MIGAVIGPQGKVIQGIQEETGTVISIDEDEKTGVGRVEIASKDKESIDKALARIKAIVAQPEEGEVYEGTVRSILDFGAFVDIGVHLDGLVHISQVADRRVRHPSEVVSVGDVVKVKVLEVDEKKKRISLSMKQAN